MPLQKKILKLLLWSLAIAGVSGAGAVLLGGDDIAMRVMATALVTAFASAMMLPQAKLLDRKPTRSAALMGITLAITVFLLALVGVWELGGQFSEEIWMTLLVIIVPGASAMICLRMLHEEDQKLAARIGLGCSLIILVLYLMAVWGSDYSGYEFKGWSIAMCFSIYAVITVICLVRAKISVREWRWWGVIASIVGCGIGMHEIAAEDEQGKTLFIIATTIAIGIAHANLVLQAKLKSGQKWLAIGAIGSMVLAAILLDILLIYNLENNDIFARLIGAISIATACATSAVGVLARINRGVDAEPGAFEMVNVSMSCPRCQKKQTLPLGDSRCGGCDLRIHIRVEEPRCTECGYLLYKLTSESCPECGTAIHA